jgi:hypothetical protein
MQHLELLLFFGLISFIYSSVGFGGASSYLALLAVYQLPVYEMKLTALLCNIIVVTSGSILFIIKKQVDFRKILPLIVLSVPMAYVGGKMKLSVDVFFILLGCSLIVASLFLCIKPRDIENPAAGRKNQGLESSFMGASIGFLSGMVGIGGGIFLSPLLHLIKWDAPKKIAATASVFILVNSISGLAAHLQQPHGGVNFLQIGMLCFAVFLGGQLGSRLGITKFKPLVIRRVTAALVFAAGVQVLQNHLHLHW